MPAYAGLDVRSEVYLGAWTPVPLTGPGSIRNSAPITITRGRQNLKSQISPSTATFTVDNRDARWTIRNPTGPWYGRLLQNTPIRFSVPSSLAGIPCYLRLETDTASYASAPDTASLQITSGTLSVRVDCKITDWIGNHVLLAKWGSTAHAWALWTNSTGTIQFACNDGTNDHSNSTSVPLPYLGQRLAIRADYNISASTVTFYTAPTMAGSWTQLGAVQPVGTGALNGGAGQIVQVGAGAGLPGMYGEVYEAQVYSTSTLEADPVFTSQTPGATSFTDSQTNTWTLAGTAELSGRLYRFHGELASLPKAADPSQRDAYSQATAGGLLRRAQQQQTPAGSPMFRAYARIPSSDHLAAYWPAEDLAGAQQIGPAVGKIPMGNANLTMASSSVFTCSDKLPVMNGGTASALVDPGSVVWQDNSVRFLLAIPAADDTNNAIVCQFATTGTVATVRLIYGTGGNLTLLGYSAAGVQLFTSSPFIAFGLSILGACRIAISLVATASGITWSLTSVQPGASSGNQVSGNIAGTIGAVTSVSFGGGLVGSAMGHFSVQGVNDNIFALGRPLGAWLGETAAARFLRICGEEGIACRITGSPDKSVAMGNQPIQTVQAILQECEDTDQGLITELRQILGLGYITSGALSNQAAAVVLDVPSGQVDPKLSPSSDDTLVVNDVTMTTAGGSKVRQVLSSGPMSVQSPPAGVGRFDTSVSSNPSMDSQLPSLASWYLHVRSADEDRYPAIPVQQARGTIPAGALLADIGAYIKVTNPPAWVPPGPVRQICVGITESLGPQPLWPIAFNCTPEAPWETAIADDPVLGRAESDGTYLTQPVSAVATTLPLLAPSGPQWTTTPAHFPFDIKIGGERMTATANAAGATGLCRVGAFLGPGSMGVADFTAALAQWTGNGLYTPGAVRWYKNPGDFTYDTSLGEIITAGIKVVLEVRPSASPVSAADLASLTTLLQTMKTNGANAVITMWAEPYYNGLTISQYQAAVLYYGPTIREFFPLAFCTNVYSVANFNENAYYPGDAYIDVCASDYYANASSLTLDQAAQPANSASPKKPFGLYEIGSSTDPITGQSSGTTNTFQTYIQNYFAARAAAGLANADLLWFCSGENNTLLGGGSSQNAGFEGGNGSWAARAGTTLTNTNTQHNTGLDAAQCACATAGNIGIQLGNAAGSGAIAVTPGVTYTLAAWFKAATTGRSVIVGVNWYTAAGAFISSSGFGGVTADVTTGWTQASQTCLAPPTAAFANLICEALSAVLTEVHYIDDVTFSVQNAVSAIIGFDFGSSPTSDFRIADLNALHTALDNTSAPQSFTVTRSVNGVAKAHNAGELMTLWNPAYLRI